MSLSSGLSPSALLILTSPFASLWTFGELIVTKIIRLCSVCANDKYPFCDVTYNILPEHLFRLLPLNYQTPHRPTGGRRPGGPGPPPHRPPHHPGRTHRRRAQGRGRRSGCAGRHRIRPSRHVRPRDLPHRRRQGPTQKQHKGSMRPALFAFRISVADGPIASFVNQHFVKKEAHSKTANLLQYASQSL